MGEGRRELRLSDLGVFDRGHGITKADLVDVGVPCLRYGEIYSTYDDTTESLSSFVSDDSSFEATPLHHGDIVFAASGETREEIGKAVAWLGHGRAVVGGDTIILRGHGQDPTYLAHALNADSVVRQKYRLGKGQSVVHIHVTDLAKVSIHLPPLRQQRKIARTLRTWDEAIDKLGRLRMAQSRHRRGVLRALLTAELRLLGFGSRSWRGVRLGEIAEVIVSSVDKKTKSGERPVRLCNYTDVYACHAIHPRMGLMKASATSTEIERCRLRVGDVVITKDSEDPNDIAVPAVVEETAPDLVCGYHLAIIRPGPAADGLFLKYCFDLPSTRAYFASRANGATRFGLTVGSIEGAIIRIPGLAEQRRIAEVLRTCDEVIATISRQIDSVVGQKRSLQQKLTL